MDIIYSPFTSEYKSYFNSDNNLTPAQWYANEMLKLEQQDSDYSQAHMPIRMICDDVGQNKATKNCCLCEKAFGASDEKIDMT